VANASMTYSVDGVELGDCDAMTTGSWACGIERAGHFVIVTSADGFLPHTLEVDVAEGVCHVEAVVADIVLEAVDCTAESVVGIEVALSGASGEVLEGESVLFRDAMVDDSAWETCSGAEGSWACAENQAGTFDVVGTADGHSQAFELVTVPLDEAGCHPVTQTVDLIVDWLPD
jgi:hypothetical protein